MTADAFKRLLVQELPNPSAPCEGSRGKKHSRQHAFSEGSQIWSAGHMIRHDDSADVWEGTEFSASVAKRLGTGTKLTYPKVFLWWGVARVVIFGLNRA